MSDWTPVFVLPNVNIGDAIEIEHIALISLHDKRCKDIAKEIPTFSGFISSFTDAFKRKVTPSILVVRKDAPTWVMSMDAIAGFRDAISIASVAQNRSIMLIYNRPTSHQYTTSFDFYAWSFSKNFDVLTTNNPAMWGIEEFKDFRGQSTAGLPTSSYDTPKYDKTLLKALLGEWLRRFSSSNPSWRSLALFRSLNMAHAAGQIPAVVDVTAQSLGRSVSLWVSAFEILAHPGDKDSGLKEVYRVLETVDWQMRTCCEKKYPAYQGRSGKTIDRALPCWIYGEMYHARNDFMHGNRLTDDRLVRSETKRSLFVYTPSLYRMLLTGFLSLARYGPHQKSQQGAVARVLDSMSDGQHDHERAIATIIKPMERY